MEKINIEVFDHDEKRYILKEVRFCIDEATEYNCNDKLDWFIFHAYNKLKRLVDSMSELPSCDAMHEYPKDLLHTNVKAAKEILKSHITMHPMHPVPNPMRSVYELLKDVNPLTEKEIYDTMNSEHLNPSQACYAVANGIRYEKILTTKDK